MTVLLDADHPHMRSPNRVAGGSAALGVVEGDHDGGAGRSGDGKELSGAAFLQRLGSSKNHLCARPAGRWRTSRCSLGHRPQAGAGNTGARGGLSKAGAR